MLRNMTSTCRFVLGDQSISSSRRYPRGSLLSGIPCVSLRLCERVVMLEDLLDVLENQLVQVEEQKAQGSQTAKDLAALQEVLLAEAEKVRRNTPFGSPLHPDTVYTQTYM